jgi:electron transport protein HydN
VKQQNLGPLTVRSFVTQAHKCDLCVDVAGGPACIPVCPTKALHLIDPDSLRTKIEEKRENSAFSLPTDALR